MQNAKVCETLAWKPQEQEAINSQLNVQIG